MPKPPEAPVIKTIIVPSSLLLIFLINTRRMAALTTLFALVLATTFHRYARLIETLLSILIEIIIITEYDYN